MTSLIIHARYIISFLDLLCDARADIRIITTSSSIGAHVHSADLHGGLRGCGKRGGDLFLSGRQREDGDSRKVLALDFSSLDVAQGRVSPRVSQFRRMTSTAAYRFVPAVIGRHSCKREIMGDYHLGGRGTRWEGNTRALPRVRWKPVAR